MIAPYEIYIIHLTWECGGKKRPVLAFIVDEDTIDIYKITTKFSNKNDEIKALYFKITDWAQAGLGRESYVDTGTMITLTSNAFNGKNFIGKLTDADKQRLLKFLCR